MIYSPIITLGRVTSALKPCSLFEIFRTGVLCLVNA
jgi:hypothetical protein